jgi:diguanylate cyclase (GGDEF)-like protein/PAS domain S-box-containing protein
MVPNRNIPKLRKERPKAVAPAILPATADPLREIRALKRVVQIGVYAAILGTEPFYLFVLHYSWSQLLSGLFVGLIIATVAIEGAFGQMFKLRRRSAYPSLLLQALSSASDVGAAADQALPIINRLLRIRGSAVALSEESGGLRLLSVSVMAEEDALHLLEQGKAETARVLEGDVERALVSEGIEAHERFVTKSDRVVLVPLAAMTRTLGVLVLVGRKGKSDLGDFDLLKAVGTALGLSIENLRDKEELARTASLLSTALESTADGILVVGKDGKIERSNAKFLEMWKIPDSIVESRDDDKALEFVLQQLDEPEAFMNRVRELYAQPDAESIDTVVFKDGRVFERFSQPRRLNGRNVGRVWTFRDVTETKRAEEALAANEKRFRALIENSTDGISLMDADGVCVYGAPSTERILGYKPEELIGVNAFDLIHPDDIQDAGQAMASLLTQPSGTQASSNRFRLKDGSWHWFEGTATNLLHDPAVRAIVMNYRDITERREAEEALRESEEQFRLIQESALDAIITMNADGEITSWNPQAETIFGWTRDEAVGRPLAETLIPERHRETHKRGLERVIATGEGPILNKRTEVTALDRAGREFPVELAVVPLYRGESVSFCAFVRDISERKKAEETIRHLAYHDVLTGLPNRVLFEERLRLALAQARRSRTKVAVMFLDLDRFKLVNDTVGHTGGDQLLQEVAGEFSETIREGDTVARVGGDEFTFLLPGIERAEDATAAAERILQRVRKPRTVAGQEFRVTTSIGITVFPRDGGTADILMRNADTAMYRAKERGRDNYQLYTPAMKASLQEMLALENDLSHALERNELFVLYQPLVSIDSGSIVGGEALLRWQHPQRGLVGPEEFIPLAEETGLIGPIGEWVLQTACQQAKEWHDSDLSPIRITVNVSARQIEQPGLVRAVADVLADTGLPPQRLQLELTEGAVMRQVDSVTSALAKLRSMGVGISVDDFGTGYSSLGYLKRFPIETIKIDRTFVRDVATDQNDAAIVTTVIAMARGLNLRVVAEGVETEAQLGFLRENKCDEFQGFLVSPAVSPPQFEALVRQRQGRHAIVLPLKFR